MNRISGVNIRPMHHDERSSVRAIMRRAFHPIEQCFVEWTPNVLVAEQGEKLLGAVVLKGTSINPFRLKQRLK